MAKELPFYSARRFHQNSIPTNQLVINWSLPRRRRQLLPSVYFRASHLVNNSKCRMSNHGFTNVGPFQYCTASEKCAWCLDAHDSRTCIHRAPPSAAVSTLTYQDPSPTIDAKWKRPRCHQPGVNAWHRCARCSGIPHALPSAASHMPTCVLLPTPAPPSPTNSSQAPTQVSALQEADC